MKTVGVVLSGCGYLDGAEIYESVLTLLYLDQAGVKSQCLAPDILQMDVVNHMTGEPVPESRSVLLEAARLARGDIAALDDGWVDKLDAAILPGGYGAAKNFCNFAVHGENCEIDPSIESFLLKMIEAGRPIGLICISPVVLARTLKGKGVHPDVTVGAHSPAVDAIEHFGSRHITCPATGHVVDRTHRIISTPAYMYDTRIADVARGIEKLVWDVISMTA